MKRPILRMILGIVFSVLLLATFFVVSLFVSLFVPTQEIWNYVSGALRLLMGFGAMGIFIWLFGRAQLKEGFSLKGIGKGFLPSLPILLFCVMCFVVMSIGFTGFRISDIPSFIFTVFLFPLATSFFEELAFRGLFTGGYFLIKHQNRFTRLVFALLSSVFFTACHPQYYTDLLRLLSIFAFGFCLASIFLFSRSILTCTILHFLYNLSIAILRYVRNESSVLRIQIYLSLDFIYIAMFAVGLLFILLKKPYIKKLPQEEDLSEELQPDTAIETTE